METFIVNKPDLRLTSAAITISMSHGKSSPVCTLNIVWGIVRELCVCLFDLCVRVCMTVLLCSALFCSVRMCVCAGVWIFNARTCMYMCFLQGVDTT
jgi:hypothetical protein